VILFSDYSTVFRHLKLQYMALGESVSMSLLIWRGRKAKYNRYVLEALSDGEKTAWDIAKYIVMHDPVHARGNWYHQAQKVNSNLVRRGGVLDDLVESCFIDKKNGKYSLTILGFMYVLHQINHAWWKLPKDKLFQSYWPIITDIMAEFLKENLTQRSLITRWTAYCLTEIFSAYPEKPPTWTQELWEGISNSMMRKFVEYLTFGKNPRELSQNEINIWVLEGVFEALKKCFGMPHPTEESQQLISLMCNSFQKLPEEDKFMIIQTLKTIVHNTIYRRIRKRETLRKAFIEKAKQTKSNQIVCYIKCPHCSYNGFSLQDGLKLLSSNFSLQCEKCKQPIDIHSRTF